MKATNRTLKLLTMYVFILTNGGEQEKSEALCSLGGLKNRLNPLINDMQTNF